MSSRDRFDSIFRPGLFDGQVFLITGGGSGIGRCIAHEVASLGATAVVAGRREEPLQQVVEEITAVGGRGDHMVWPLLRVASEGDTRHMLDHEDR